MTTSRDCGLTARRNFSLISELPHLQTLRWLRLPAKELTRLLGARLFFGG